MSRTDLQTIDGFADQVISGISAKLPRQLMSDLVIRQVQVTKTNSRVLHGITFEMKNKNMAPTFYLDEPYEDYLSGRDIDEIILELAKSYLISLVGPMAHIPEEPDFMSIKNHLALRVVNTDKNADLLEDVPHKSVEFGLSLICDVKMDDGSGGCWRTHVLYSFLDGETEDTLFKQAFANVRRVEPPVLRTIFPATVPESCVINLLNSKQRIREHEKEPMYVLTTRGGYYGAAAFFYPGMMKEVADKLGESYYAIPSSVHEFVIIPLSTNPEVRILENILKESNQIPGSSGDMISENVFFYDIASNSLSIASDNAMS